MKYVRGFDTVRCFAVFFVIVSHWGMAFTEHSTLDTAIQIFIPGGLFGVTLFFVLSGYLITSILLNERKKNIDSGGGKELTIIKNFFVRRVLRIFPIYYITIFLLLILNYPYLREHAWYFLLYISNVLVYNTNAPNPLMHTWSLAVEEQFYLLWPWLILFLKEKHLKYMFVLAIAVGIVSKYYMLYVLNHGFPFLVFNCFDAFGLGGLYAYIRMDSNRDVKFRQAFMILFPLFLFIGWRMAPVGGSQLGVIYSRTADSVISLAIIIFVLNNKSAWVTKHLLENSMFNFIGKISYGMYLYHYILGNYYDDFISGHSSALPVFANPYISFCTKLALLILVSWISFRIIEQPILRLKKRFEYTRAGAKG